MHPSHPELGYLGGLACSRRNLGGADRQRHVEQFKLGRTWRGPGRSSSCRKEAWAGA